jgi:GMP synthase-like glutamine amidotransferase
VVVAAVTFGLRVSTFRRGRITACRSNATWDEDGSLASCLIIQHAEIEEAYGLSAALTARGVRLEVLEVFASDPVPNDTSGFDGLVVMGGPASATSDDGFPTRRGELALLADAVQRGIPTLGICLGAQLLAAAAGGQVVIGEAGPEIGWAPISLTPHGMADPLLTGAPPHVTVLHWHGDTYTLPPGGVLLASSDRYENQAFRLGHCAWGLQFHLEVDVEAVARFVATFGHQAEVGGADPKAIENDAPAALEGGLAAWGGLVAERFAALVGDGAPKSPPPAGGSL